MTKYIVNLLFFIPLALNLNMASPVMQGTIEGTPFVSKHVDVVHENLIIKIDKNFEYANFKVEYIINAQNEGIDIPFLFYASEYHEDFKVTIDGIPVDLLEIEDLFGTIDKEKFKDFSSLFEADPKELNIDSRNNSNGLSELQTQEFLYFKTNISQGEHKINVSYKAYRWVYKDSWLKSYSFRYALAPAKYWKSFGTLNITIDATDFKEPLATNISSKKEITAITTMSFSELPADVLLINYNPKASAFAQFLISVGPTNLSLIVTLLLVVFHILIMKKYRKQFPHKKISIVALAGGILIPVIFIICYILVHFVIESSIGEHASGQRSYGAFYSFMQLPKYWVIYLIVVWVIDLFFKKQNIRNSSY